MQDRARAFHGQCTRRAMLRSGGLGFLGMSLAGSFPASPARAADETKPAALLAPLNRMPRMVQEFFVRQLREFEEHADKRRAALHSADDARIYVREVREKIQQCLGPWPERTPLNARVTGVLERDGYRVEKLIFESRPNFLVTANLYVPNERKFPLPGVVGACGHSEFGKAGDTYQSFAQGLVRMGYVVLIYDPLGQAERVLYVDDQLKPRMGRHGVPEHTHAGSQQLLVGESLASWTAWDGMRAMDYLLSRPEVDKEHVGITGNSGGGTQTTWLCGVEPRFTMAAPSCFVTTFRRNLENELPADAEQCPPRVLALGLDESDFVLAMAPKPVILLGKEMDFFDVRGFEEAFERLRAIYKLLGVEQNAAKFIGPGSHGFSQDNREALYRWFNGVTKISDAEKEPALPLEKEQDLWCTPNGRVAELKSRTIFSFIQERSRALGKERPRLDVARLKQTVSEVLKLPPRSGVPEYRIMRSPTSSRRYPEGRKHSVTYLVETEPGIDAAACHLAPAQIFGRPRRGVKRAILYVSHQSSDVELRDEPLIREVLEAEPDAAFYTCDVRGIGESRPNTTYENNAYNRGGADYFYAIHSVMLDRPYAGQRTHDVLRVLDWLASHEHQAVHLVAKGWGAIPATFAALLSDLVTQVTLKNALTSYSDVAESEDYNWPLSAFVPDVLKHFDLPDCYRALEAKKLRQIDPKGANA